MTSVVEAARAALGPVGVVLPVSLTSAMSLDEQRAAVGRLEAAGYRAAWTNEVLGKDALVQLAVLLAATRRMVFGTGIANVWTRAPQTMHAAAAQLAQAFPGRFVLGLGVGYPHQAEAVRRDFGSPLATMRDYVERMGAETWPPAPDAGYPRIIAANGPKMLALAGELADGALPAGLPPESTARAREVLGPDKLLVCGLTVRPDSDRERAKAAARDGVAELLRLPAYRAGISRLGFTDQDIVEVSDRLVAALVGYGDPESIADSVRAHLAAGADHVTLLLPIDIDFETGVAQFEQLAPAMSAID
jgi:probable F420-dependent oxidoreductase